MYHDLLLEERYKQLETNFKAIVSDLQTRPDWGKAATLDELLARLDAELKHALMRQQASGMSAPQRLEERTAILQRTFKDVVELMGDTSSTASVFVTPRRGNGDSTSASTPRSASAIGNGPLTARPTGAGATPMAPATGAPTASPHLPTHPWGGGAYTNPAPSPSQAAADARTPTRATAASSPQTMPRYDIQKAYLIASLMASLMASNDR